MPSLNSINKPNYTSQKKSHANSMAKRKASRSRTTTRSSTSRYNDEAVPTPTESKAVGLYTGTIPTPGNVTNKTLSKKRARKIARNQKYVDSRNARLTDDIQMDLDSDNSKKTSLVKIKSKVKKESETERLNKVLWDAVNAPNMEIFKNSPISEEGTTIGVQSF